jgi:hypothetical protein
MLGFHFESSQTANIPTSREPEELADLISAIASYNEPRYVLSTTGDLSVFDNDCPNGGPSITTLSQNGDVHYFEKFFHKEERYRDNIMEIFRRAKRITGALAWPLKPFGGAGYRLHRGEIEIYMMGGTKELPEKQKAWREDFAAFGKDVYSTILKGNYEIEAVEERPSTMFKKSGAYHSGYLKTVVRPRFPDLDVNKLP